MIFIKIILLIFESLSFAKSGFIPNKLMGDPSILEVVRADGQCRGHDVIMQSYHHGFKSTIRKAFVANHTGIVKQDILEDLKMNVTITRCLSRENLDSCDEFQNFKNLDYCSAVDPDNILTSQSPFAIKYTPKFKCPLKKGAYHAYNTTLDITAFSFLNMNGMYWKAKIDVFKFKTQIKLIYCLHLEAYKLPRSQLKEH